MSDTARTPSPRTFHTIKEAAALLRVDAVTIYRAIREGGFPAVKIRGRYVVPAAALEQIADEAVNKFTCVDLARFEVRQR